MKNDSKNGKNGAYSNHDLELEAAPETELDRLVAGIGRASKLLNDAASDATRRIEALEERLLAVEPGISVWGETLLTEQASYPREDGATEVGQRSVTLGFDRVKKDKWGIAVREQITGEKGVVEEDVTLLRKADRGLRLLALPHLEGLVRQILGALEQQVSRVESLKQSEVAARDSQPVDSALAS